MYFFLLRGGDIGCMLICYIDKRLIIKFITFQIKTTNHHTNTILIVNYTLYIGTFLFHKNHVWAFFSFVYTFTIKSFRSLYNNMIYSAATCARGNTTEKPQK